MKQCIRQAATIATSQFVKKVNPSHTRVIRSYNVWHLYLNALAFHSSLRIAQRAVCHEVAGDSDDGIIMPFCYIHISITSKVERTSLLFH
ncbi:hypothetical protein T03_18076 [Trichinella britovi]|uniref:Uncharacterized protein n=1 Tax=Trichinella britovi TaxID=45882 RepID=A0A0V0Z940_TRIBR|nr:hypothetical protein T03_18076 [Trichinella britovi]